MIGYKNNISTVAAIKWRIQIKDIHKHDAMNSGDEVMFRA